MSSKNTRIGFIGMGNMGVAIWRAIRSDYHCMAYDVHPNKSLDVEYKNSQEELVGSSDILILSVKPIQVPSVLSKISSPVDVISIAAGVKLDTMRSFLPVGSRLVRTMPNLPLMVGEGCLGYYGDQELHGIVKGIFSKLGLVLELPREDLLDSVTGLSGSGPAFVFSFLHSMAEGGVKAGLSYKESLDLASQTILGSIRYFQEERAKNPNIHPMELRNRVTSPGGTTIYGLGEWEKNSVGHGIMESVFQAYLRSKDL